jgi:glycosyltransferase involved in cell wall biosynthesis
MRIDVCIATFKRPALLDRLLRDLLAQDLPAGVSTRIIVVDNDVQESARPVVEAFQVASAALSYLTQPEQNIAITRNRALEHSRGDLIAFIDDDESAPTGWLAALLHAMEQYKADVVLGPVRGAVPPTAPHWIRSGKFFEPPALLSGSRVALAGGTGNALVKASAIRGKVSFDPRYGLSGSEDTDFFYSLSRSGATLVWCEEALLTEYVSEDRLTARWLLGRGFRGGQRYADVVGRPEPGIRLAGWLCTRAALALAAGLLSLCCLPFSRALAMRYGIRFASNLGQVSTLGDHRFQEYRE